MINTTGHFLRFNMGEEEDTSLPKTVSVDNTYPKDSIEEVFQNIKKGVQVSINSNEGSPATDLVEHLQGQNITTVGDYDVFVPEVGVVTINITHNLLTDPEEINLKITNITKTEENPILYDPYLECYYMIDTNMSQILKVLYYKQYQREDNYRKVEFQGSYGAIVQLVPQINYLGEIALLQFDYKNINLHNELLYNIPIVGRFIATVDDMNIILSPDIQLSGGNPPIYSRHEYEYNIFAGKFNLMDITLG